MGTEKIKDEDIERTKKKPAKKTEDFAAPKQTNFIEAKKSFWQDAEEKERKDREEREAQVAPLTSENLSLKESIEKVKSWKKQLTDTPPDTPPSTLGRQKSTENKDFRKSELNKAESKNKPHSKQKQQKKEIEKDWESKQSGYKPKPRPTYAGLPQFPVRKKMVESSSSSSSESSSESSSGSSSSSSSTSGRAPSPYDNVSAKKPPAPARCTLPTMKLKDFMAVPKDDFPQRPESPYDNVSDSKKPVALKAPGKLWGARSPRDQSPDRDDTSSVVSSTVNSEDDEGKPK